MNKLLLLACVLSPSLASAEYYSAASTGGFQHRSGSLLVGASLGVGAMGDNGGSVSCTSCQTLSGQAAVHLGGFVSPRLALMAELQSNFQTLSSDELSGDTSVLVQGALMFAAQHWVTPRLWIKGGVGAATLQVDRSYYGDGTVDETTIPEYGLAVMGAIGVEVYASRELSVDLQARVLDGAYAGLDYHLAAGSIGIGVNWE